MYCRDGRKEGRTEQGREGEKEGRREEGSYRTERGKKGGREGNEAGGGRERRREGGKEEVREGGGGGRGEEGGRRKEGVWWNHPSSELLTLGAHARSEGYCSCPVCMYVCMCVHSYLPPHTLESQNRDTNEFIAVQGLF